MNILDEQIEGIVRFYVSWVFLQFTHVSTFGRGATCPPYDLKSQKGQIEGIIRFYAASATCQGDKLKWTPTCQGTNCGARMFPGFLLNLSLFLSPALGQLGVGPLSHGCAVPASRLPPRVLSASGRRPAPTDAAAETGRWATSHRDVVAPKGGAKSRLPLWGRCHAFGMTERATRPRRARAPVVRTGVSVAHRPKARIDSGGTPPFGKGASLFP